MKEIALLGTTNHVFGDVLGSLLASGLSVNALVDTPEKVMLDDVRLTVQHLPVEDSERVREMLEGYHDAVLTYNDDLQDVYTNDLTHKYFTDTVNAARDAGKQVCAVGTSVLRAMATAESMGGHMKTYDGWTNKFIFPPYDFTVATSLITNFHMPYSTMLMMVAAFGGYELIMEAYRTAIGEGYRFGCYGDAMLIL